MSKLNAILGMGKRSLQTSQMGLQTVSHNIANKSTEGYSRQRVEQTSTPPTGQGRVQIGTGATVAAVRSIKNEYLEKQIQGETEKLGFQESRSENMTRVEQVFNEQLNKGLNQFIGDFFNSFRELANAPESAASRTLVKETAKSLVNDFRRVNNQLIDVQIDIDHQIENEVSLINSMAKEIASLNEKISQVEIQGRNANDERDRRDLLLKQLGEKVDIKYAENELGQVSVMAGSNATIVSGFSHAEIFAQPSNKFEGHRHGTVKVMFKASETTSPVDITKQLSGGRIGAALEVRDEYIEGLLDQLDEVAFTLNREVNSQHINGKDRRGQNGVLFFDLLQSKSNAAANLKLNDSVENDVNRIVAGQSSNGPGDNRIANSIASIQNKKVLNDGTASMDDFYTAIVGKVAVTVNKANMSSEHQKGIVDQLANIRESISGVSLDEETTKMIELQKSFDASARLIRTADEMFDTVLNIKRY